jgi:hypothetical protein
MSGIKFHLLLKIIAQELLTPLGDFSIQPNDLIVEPIKGSIFFAQGKEVETSKYLCLGVVEGI